MAFTEWLVILSAALSALAAGLAYLALRAASRPQGSGAGDLPERIAALHETVRQHPEHLRGETASLREEHGRQARELREEVTRLVTGFQAALAERFDKLGDTQTSAATTLRKELIDGQTRAGEVVETSTKRFGDLQRERLDLLAGQMKELREGAATGQKEMRETLAAEIGKLRQENEAKLEQMRLTVDEKLQGTLEQRLGESFKQVSEQLASVHQGLGDMKALASDVGGLQRVLTNVKSRGGWGEVQLSRLIEDRFTADQYCRNFRPQDRGQEVVEYAVKLPGRDEDGCYIPIDSKFPIETYERLLAAQERGDLAEIDRAGKALDQVIRAEALRICKYLNPPRTTDFAVMFLPTEGLFAEVIRRPGLFDELQRDRRVTVTGPTTLSAFLASLDLGFRTLQIEKRASEVWQVLGAAKAEFNKYGAVWEKLEKQLDSAKNTVAEAGRRTRAVERRLRGVETVEALEAPAITLALVAPDLVDEEDEAA